MTEHDSGIEFNITAKGKLVLTARKNGEEVTFNLTPEQAREFRRQVQSIVAELEKEWSA